MHSVAESAYAAANEWLMSFGEECDDDGHPDQSTEPSSPSDTVGKFSESSQNTPEPRPMHACMSTRVSRVK